MASTNSPPNIEPSALTEDLAAKALNKRYECLVTVRTKAIKGKGAWYWAHLEPVLIRNPSTSLPKAVKLKCSLCDAVFSASNPSRTASEHLKRGTCPNLSSISRSNASPSPLPISSIPSPTLHNHKKRSSQMKMSAPVLTASYQVHSLAMIEPTRSYAPLISSPVAQNPLGMAGKAGLNQHQLVLSGGKDDLGALEMLENSVKKLKSPHASPGPRLSKEQIDSAIELLTDWFIESCGSVSLSCLEHPKFKAMLNQLGLPSLPRTDILGARLDTKFEEAKADSDARIRDAMFFQIASDGWKNKNCCGYYCGEESIVKFMVNLPNGTTVFQKALFTGGLMSSKYAEEVILDTVNEICGSGLQRCVGIIADRYKAKALRNLEIKNHWMVNLSCQLQGILSLIKDFNKELPLFRIVTENCLKVANFVNTKSQIRNCLNKYKVQELEGHWLLHVPSPNCDTSKNFSPVYSMLDDMLNCAHVLQMVVLDESYKLGCMEDPLASEISSLIQNERFWDEMEAAHSLVKMIRGMAQEIEVERPLIGQCLPLWEELRTKVKEWCGKFSIAEGPVEKILEKRFRKNYHPAWSAAFILDPLYLRRDINGKYLPPFKCLSQEQEKDVDSLINRLVSREEAHVAFVELAKWRSEGLDPLYAQAVQVKQRDPLTGKMKIVNPQSRRLVWETCLSEFKTLGKVALRLIFLHSTSCGYKCKCSVMNLVCSHRHSRVGLERAQKMVFVAAHAKLERRDFSNEEDRDAELFAMTDGENDMLNEVFSDAPSITVLNVFDQNQT
ncbi:uncharacterized protein LOC111024962 isoform X1 [Momordica charantia]|uniref:Uncharacterized protein LOC111024962 isoform X1 n=1 Tax=Momordica charantia TaxID=3673 RepID=A0A6J1DW05_MOMCH|nr:uncharacterized protein LOC111024962 isoform X1 [Momordica charantia]XP_022158488.1 uncharacterized protein LOC111024962 isoform X1 [Momordica charantia]XP_022158495.1 uncharacterized protein LOC111024962 isoform X1 [Momordica charantia]XP_022158503.1 uncharacterized protein LOC111024962 isoform X1 [Momordica charantia]XP_022158510.1 uncharacterized protein LOC111024962 isoform X1 [Momordica charantia]XP_022158515.1 uncharacterized protein LOC111024962 isoform X1 [Momordica charantia]